MIHSKIDCSPNIFVNEIQSQYEFLEKLHCIVIAEKFVITKNETDILNEIFDIKAKTLQEIEDKRKGLVLLQAKLSDSDIQLSLGIVQKTLSKLKSLIKEIIHIQKANAMILSDLISRSH